MFFQCFSHIMWKNKEKQGKTTAVFFQLRSVDAGRLNFPSLSGAVLLEECRIRMKPGFIKKLKLELCDRCGKAIGIGIILSKEEGGIVRSSPIGSWARAQCFQALRETVALGSCTMSWQAWRSDVHLFRTCVRPLAWQSLANQRSRPRYRGIQRYEHLKESI